MKKIIFILLCLFAVNGYAQQKKLVNPKAKTTETKKQNKIPKTKITASKRPVAKAANKYEACADCNGTGKCLSCGGVGKKICNNHNAHWESDEECELMGLEQCDYQEDCTNCSRWEKNWYCNNCLLSTGICFNCDGSGKQLKAK